MPFARRTREPPLAALPPSRARYLAPPRLWSPPRPPSPLLSPEVSPRLVPPPGLPALLPQAGAHRAKRCRQRPCPTASRRRSALRSRTRRIASIPTPATTANSTYSRAWPCKPCKRDELPTPSRRTRSEGPWGGALVWYSSGGLPGSDGGPSPIGEGLSSLRPPRGVGSSSLLVYFLLCRLRPDQSPPWQSNGNGDRRSVRGLTC